MCISKSKVEKNQIITDNKKRITIVSITLAIVLISVWIIIETIGGGKFSFKNNTSYNIEYMEATFVNDVWQVSDTLKFDKLMTDGIDTKHFDEFNLNNLQANLQLEIKFEGYDPFVLVAGYFDDLFTGNINVTLDEVNKDEVDIFIKAKNGIISSRTTDCDENYRINVTEGYIE